MPYVQRTGDNSNAGSSTTSVSGAFPGSVATGSCLAAFVTYAGSDATISSMVRGSDTFTERFHVYEAVSTVGIRLFTAPNAGSGTGATTATFSTTVSQRLVDVVEISGADLVSPYGGSAGQYLGSPGTATDGWTSGANVPSAQPGIQLVWGFNLSNGDHLIPGTGFTDRGDIATFSYGLGNLVELESKVFSSLSSSPGTFSDSTSEFGFVVTMNILDAVVAAANSQRLLLMGVG